MVENEKKAKGRAKALERVILCGCIVLALIAGILIGRMSSEPDTEQGTAVTAMPAVTPLPTNVSANAATDVPTGVPTDAATHVPTNAPTDMLTNAPTGIPTDAATHVPTNALTDMLTDAPTGVPTDTPTGVPTNVPGQTAEPIVPANPMNQADNTENTEAKIITYRPLRNAERIRIAMNQEELPLYGAKIGIDPGHQRKSNNGKEPVSPGSSEMKAKVSSGTQGVATRVPEYVVNLDVSLQLRDALEALGAEVYLTRDTHDIDISNVERAVMMNELEVDMVLRIHCNGSENQSTKGISLFVKSTGAGAEESYAICEALLPAMVDATGARSLGIYKRDTYSGMNWSTVPSILVEMGFMSNPEEDRQLNDPDYQAKLVDGMVQGIADYMGRSLDIQDEPADENEIGE